MPGFVDIPSIADCRVDPLPRIQDQRGNLTFLESGRHVPFVIHRTYWIYDVPGGAHRGGHAYATLQEFVIALSGSFDVDVSDGMEKRTFTLNRSYSGLYVPPMIWRQLGNFSTNAVCLVVASAPYDEADYVRDYGQFIRMRLATQ